MQKENKFFFSFPNESTFDEVKVTKNWEKYQNNSSFSEYETTVASTGSIWEISFVPLP